MTLAGWHMSTSELGVFADDLHTVDSSAVVNMRGNLLRGASSFVPLTWLNLLPKTHEVPGQYMTLCSSKVINASMGSRKRDHGHLRTPICTYLRLAAVSGESWCFGQP